jgi:hypothetical protein
MLFRSDLHGVDADLENFILSIQRRAGVSIKKNEK